MIYLDSAATTAVPEHIAEEMLKYMTHNYANASSSHEFGQKAKEEIEDSRSKVASLFGGSSANVVFTSGGSEGNSMIFHIIQNMLKSNGKMHIITSSVEHDSVHNAIKMLIKLGFDVTFVDPDRSGQITPWMIEDLIREDTGLVSIIHCNNETGVVNDISKIGSVCKKNGALFHSDCVQSSGQIKLDMANWDVDFATISSHKIHGPKGVGAVYIKDLSSIKAMLSPMVFGGSNQEFGMRGGTENVPGIIGFGMACEEAARCIEENMSDISIKKQMFIKELLLSMGCKSLSEAEIFANFNSYLSPGKILSLTIEYASSDTLVMMMGVLKIYISSGSACKSHEIKPNRVLLSYGLTEDQAKSTIRVSFSKLNTEEEIKNAAVALAECIDCLRSIRKSRVNS